MKKLKIAAISIIAVLLILIGVFYVYTLDYYKADDFALNAFATEKNNIQVQNNMIVFSPDKQNENEAALIFYPGGKVEAIAYIPLLEKLMQNGVTCVLVKMPFNLAVFNINAADSIYEKLPEIKNWYIGGHSLGGAMASSYAEKNNNKLKGLILLGAYPVNDSDITTITIYGSEDKILDKSKLENTGNMLEILGGNHAYFGNYGEQKGDGIAFITREEQQEETVEAIIRFIR
ncbi:MAG TPA: alpha/beta fold hydrolase [Clostridiales bacterium]|nr:alpha/beta fold hydrolase [Clostridiales bacterium]